MRADQREKDFVLCVQTAAIVKDIQENNYLAQDAVEVATKQRGNLPLKYNWLTDVLVDDVINYVYSDRKKADWIKEK